MEKRPPAFPRKAWEEDSSSEESSSLYLQPFSFYDTTTMEPLQIGERGAPWGWAGLGPTSTPCTGPGSHFPGTMTTTVLRDRHDVS